MTSLGRRTLTKGSSYMRHASWRAAALAFIASFAAHAETVVIVADGYLDVVAGRVVRPAVIVVDGEKIAAVNPAAPAS